MGVISKDKRKLTVYYNSNNTIGEQTLAYANASEKELLAIDISQTNVTGTQWAEMASGLDMNISDIIDTKHPDFINTYGDSTPKMQEHDWLKILEKEPQFLKYPIVIYGEEFKHIKSAAEFKKYIEADSAGLEKKPLSKQFTDEDTP